MPRSRPPLHLRRLLRLVALGLSLAPAGCGGEQHAPEPARPAGPNLLIVSLDTTRADHLSCYGYPRPTTPFLERFAAESHRFDAAYTAMPTTLPAHAAMLTGLHPRQLGVLSNGSKVAGSAHTLAERLKEHGFATAAFVSATPLHPRVGLDQGFDAYQFPATAQAPGRSARERAVAWIRTHASERFFCFVHLFEPHTWYDPPHEREAGFPVPSGAYPPERGFLERPEELTEALRRRSIEAYDGELREADRQVEALIAALTTMGLRERTIVVVTADHGETLDELLDERPYAFDHGEFLAERELRVPLILWLPPGVSGSRPAAHAEPLGLVDLMPTLLELLGLPCEPPVAGRSFAPILRGDALEPRPVVSERRQIAESAEGPPAGEELSVRDGQWLWIRSESRPEQLFTLESGAPRELPAAEHAEVVARLRAALETWEEEHPPPAWRQREADPEHLKALESLGYTTDG
jgi:arylsulfatase A-like enzyme